MPGAVGAQDAWVWCLRKTDGWLRQAFEGPPDDRRRGQLHDARPSILWRQDTNRPIPYPCKCRRPPAPGMLPTGSVEPGLCVPTGSNVGRFKFGMWGSATELFIGGTGGKFPYAHLDYYHPAPGSTNFTATKGSAPSGRGDRGNTCIPDPKDYWKSSIPDVENVDLNKVPTLPPCDADHLCGGRGRDPHPGGTLAHHQAWSPRCRCLRFAQPAELRPLLQGMWGFRRRSLARAGRGLLQLRADGGALCRIGDAFERTDPGSSAPGLPNLRFGPGSIGRGMPTVTIRGTHAPKPR